ncbi:acetate--CoA ligase family protein [Phytoactinopolyspora mesophila]|uniref:Acetyl-CoA synthetase n=1 Tax=Phytoactinopolyspora mesophila TaxID=2650750 RepID=A0A7K3M7T5_9ACTN|nr:acetate--CoA ligase family protein [Phytoactinopolyspora mesophila]NDL59379.1 acetyl-CoA synthetase [Phytoactinopolyspora mesophila]
MRSQETHDLRVLWDARSIAVIGATDRPRALGRLPVEFLLRYGYGGRIVPVNPKGGTVCGLPAATELTERVDLALVMVPAAAVVDVVRRCGRVGVPVAIIMSSGFVEAGDDGAALQRELVDTAREAGVCVVGPNCIGSVGFRTGQTATFSPLFGAADLPRVPGRVGFATQSGALGFGTVSLALERGIGLHSAVNTGNEAAVSTLDALEALAAEPEVDALLGYTETLADGAALRRLAATGKPLALLKAGSSDAGSKAAASHTGALATSDRVVDAAFRQLGIARARDIDELLDLGAAFSSPHLPRGPRVAVVTTSGGSGILAADAIETTGELTLATLDPATTSALNAIVPAFGATANPVDVTAAVMSDRELLRRALDVVVDDDGVDAVVTCFCVLTGDQVMDIVTAVGEAADRAGKPVFVARTGADFLAPEATEALRKAGLPAYPTPARAVRALAGRWRTARATAGTGASAPVPAAGTALVEAPPPSPGNPAPQRSDEPGLKALLADHGVAVPAGRLAHDPDDAVAAVAELGGHAVVKAVVPGLIHKSEAGGVVGGVTAETARNAYTKVARLGGAVLVEEMVTAEHSLEVLVGVAASPLGQVLTVALGGVLTEVLDDASSRLLPLSREDATEMVAELRGARLLAGYRGAPPLDTAALIDLITAVSEMTIGWPDGFELDLNPVLVLPRGVRVLDAAYIPATPQPDR